MAKDKRTAQQIAHDNHRDEVAKRSGGKTADQVRAELKAERQASKNKNGLTPKGQEILRRNQRG